MDLDLEEDVVVVTLDEVDLDRHGLIEGSELDPLGVSIGNNSQKAKPGNDLNESLHDLPHFVCIYDEKSSSLSSTFLTGGKYFVNLIRET